MSREQYLNIIKREIQNTNKIIDAKIIQGIDYTREAREHKQLLRKIRQHKRKGFWGNFFKLINKLPQFSNI